MFLDGVFAALAAPRPLCLVVGCERYHVPLRILLDSVQQEVGAPLALQCAVGAPTVQPKKDPSTRGSVTGPLAGLFRAEWFAKHTRRVPAVCVVLLRVDLSAPVPDWYQQEASIESEVAMVHSSLGGHPTRMLYVCVQPPYADSAAARAAEAATQDRMHRCAPTRPRAGSVPPRLSPLPLA